MLIKIFCLSFDSAYGGFNDIHLRDFMKDKEVISIQDHLFVRNEVPYLALVIKYYPLRQELDPKMAPNEKRKESWRETLTEADMGLFNLIRDWRSQRCKKDGVPPYILLTNQQVAQIVKTRPQNMTDLMKIEGVGKARADKYGEEILKISRVNLGGEQNQEPLFAPKG